MKEYTSPTTKSEILNDVIRLWETESKKFAENPNDLYQKGRYAMMLDILKAIEIHERGEE